MPQANIEQLQTQVDKIKSDLVSLKTETSNENKKNKTQSIETNVQNIKQIINTNLEQLKNKGEETNKIEIEKLELMLSNLETYGDEIETLKVEISGSEIPSSWTHAPAAGAMMLGGGLAGFGASEVMKTKFAAERISETVSVAKTKKNMDNVVKMLEIRLKDSELLDVQKENIKKSITYFEEARDNAHAIESVKIWKKLGDKLPIEIFQKLDITPEIAQQLTSVSKDTDLLKALAASTDETEIRQLLKVKNITDIPDDAIKLFKLAGKADDIADIAKVLSVARGVKALGRGLKAIPILDIAAAGVDIRNYFNESREADLVKKTNELRGINKQQQSNFHLAMAGVDLAVGIAGFAIGCASSGPPGWIVGVVVAAAAGTTYAVTSVADTYYYDVVDFYSKNKEDYKSLYRMEIKQAILQATVRGDNSFPLSGAEAFTEVFNRSDSVDKNKSVTLEDAYRTMIYLEEKNDYPSVCTYNPEYPKPMTKKISGKELENYTKEKTELDAVIALRMEYIKKFLPHTTQGEDIPAYKKYIQDIQGANGIGAIEQIISDSKMYKTMRQDTEIAGYTDIKKYQEAKGNILKKTNEKWFTEMEKMYTTEPLKVMEIYYNVINYDAVVKDADSYKTTYTELLPKITFIKKYYDYRFGNVSLESKKSLGAINDISYTQVEEMLKNMDTKGIVLKPIVFDEQKIKDRMIYGLELDRFQDSSAEYTPSIGQNIIYRIAKEIHGYQGKNNVLDLMIYFSPQKADALGMYYDDGWYININRGKDRKITFGDIEKASVAQIMTLFTFDFSSFKGVVEAEGIDTATENSDEILNQEFHKKIQKILEEEKTFQTREKKQEVQKKIIDYIKNNATTGYVKLPYTLVNDAKRAGIGNVEYFYYTYKKGAIYTCTSKAYNKEKIDLGTIAITKSYVENVRTALSPDEQKYISYVDSSYDKLMQLKSVKGTMTQESELDLPQEFEKSIGEKAREWQTFKDSLLGYDPEIARKQLLAKYESYHSYFENLYMAILLELSGRKFSNDIDGYEYIVSVMSKMEQGFFDLENKKLLTGVLSESETTVFYAYTKSQKVFGKTIVELVSSSNEEDKKKGYRGAKQILKTMLESKTLSVTSEGKIDDINTGEYTSRGRAWALGMPVLGIVSNYQHDKSETSAMEIMLKNNLKESNYIQSSGYEVSGIKTKTSEEIGIKVLTKNEQETSNLSTEVIKEIEDTASTVVWQGQRGNVFFDPDTSVLTSRGKSVKIDASKYAINGLNTSFKNLRELIMTANLINWFKFKYPGVKDFYFGSRLGLGVDHGIYRSESGTDTQILDLDIIKEKFPSLLTADNDVKDEVISYINSTT